MVTRVKPWWGNPWWEKKTLITLGFEEEVVEVLSVLHVQKIFDKFFIYLIIIFTEERSGCSDC